MTTHPIESAARSTVTRAPAAWPPRGLDALGAGWSESSWDLACGLVVLEGLPPDASVGEWLAAELAN